MKPKLVLFEFRMIGDAIMVLFFIQSIERFIVRNMAPSKLEIFSSAEV